jgi:CelD/BcsL family acetyltransferase involved in cellulose biosynthesis
VNTEIEEIRPAQSEEWDAIWRDCSYATYFHSREWAEIWSRYKQGELRPNPLLVRFTDGQEALLPLSSAVWSGGAGKTFVSSADGNYGGWIAVDPIGKEHAILMKEFLTTELGHLFWYINPFDDLVVASGVAADVRYTIHDETYAIDLEPGFDAVYSDWSSSCRRAERKARRSGVLVKVADSEDEWREYYRAYEDSLRRWGDKALGPLTDWALFQKMFDTHSEHIKLWLAMTKDGDVAAGALMLYAQRHIMYSRGAAFEEHFPLRPVNLLFYEIIKDGCDRRSRWLDLGISAGLEGVRRFKESFGARPLDCAYVDIEPETWEVVLY